MRSVFLLSTRLSMFLTEIPIIALMMLAIRFNPSLNTNFKLYPLIIICGCSIVFIMVYLFRGISISAEEIRSIGLFSSKDHAQVKKDSVLKLTELDRGKVKLELYGPDDAPGLDWLKETGRRDNINLYRDVALGGRKSVRRVLYSFGFSGEQVKALTQNESFETEIDGIEAKKESGELGDTICLTFTKTL